MPSGKDSLINQVRRAAAQGLPQAQPMRPADQATQNRDLDTYYWTSPGVEPPRMPVHPRVDDQLLVIPTNQMEEVGENPQNHMWVTGTRPMWNDPRYWSYPLEERYTVCVPTWEEEYNFGTLDVPENTMAIIDSVSYHVTSGLAQFDLFEMAAYTPAREGLWEDMIIDPLTPDPSHRYAFAGDVTPLPLSIRGDRNHKIRFTVKARGVVNLAGNSTHNPGDPLIPNAHFRLLVHGYYAPLRHNVDGAPRMGDTGNMGHIHMDPELYLEGR